MTQELHENSAAAALDLSKSRELLKAKSVMGEERKLHKGIYYGSFEGWSSQGRFPSQDRVRRTASSKSKFRSSLFQETKLKWDRNCVSCQEETNIMRTGACHYKDDSQKAVSGQSALWVACL